MVFLNGSLEGINRANYDSAVYKREYTNDNDLNRKTVIGKGCGVIAGCGWCVFSELWSKKENNDDNSQ